LQDITIMKALIQRFVNEVIEKLFQERLKMKQRSKLWPFGNPIEQQYKLILNSAYGKTLLKAREDECM
jgi:hypothetical protein